MALTLSLADSALKEDYLPPMREQLNNTNLLLMQIEKNTKDVEGRRAVLSLHVRRNNGVGARAEGGTLPSAGQQKYAEERVGLRFNYGRIELTGPVIRAMKSDNGSFVRAVQSETKGVTNDLKRDVNRQLWGTSDGVIVAIAAGSTTTVINFATTATAVQKRQIEIGMLVDIGTSTPFTSVGVAREVTAVSATTFTVTPAFTAAPAAADSVVRNGSGGSGTAQQELTGVQTIINSTGTLFNVSPTTEPVWASTVQSNSGTLRTPSENVFTAAVHATQIASGDDAIDAFVTSDGVYRAYANTMAAQKRYPNTLELKGGFTGLSITAGAGANEIPLSWDRDAPSNIAWGMDWSSMFEHQMSDWEWMQEDGAVLARVSGRDAYEATLFKYHELTIDQRNAFCKVGDLIEA